MLGFCLLILAPCETMKAIWIFNHPKYLFRHIAENVFIAQMSSLDFYVW